MSNRLEDVLSGNEANYILPFLWQRGEEESGSARRWRGFTMRAFAPCAWKLAHIPIFWARAGGGILLGLVRILWDMF